MPRTKRNNVVNFSLWRGKDHIASIIGMHADIDFHGVVEGRRTINAAIAKLKIKPTAVVFSGHGLHLYYRFANPFPPEQIPSHEERLKRLCELVAADKSAAEAARVLRLPGSYNSTYGDWIEVSVIDELSTWKSYPVSGLDVWLEKANPVLSYKPTARVTKSKVVKIAPHVRHISSSSQLTGKHNARRSTLRLLGFLKDRKPTLNQQSLDAFWMWSSGRASIREKPRDR